MPFNLLGSPDYINGITCVYFIPKLIYIPIDSQQTIVNNANIRAHTFHFLGVPQGISVVIAEGEKDCILIAAFKVISGHITGHIFITTVMVIPFLLSHDNGSYQADQTCCNIYCSVILSRRRDCPDKVSYSGGERNEQYS